MQVEVDISGRIEETGRPSVLAMANGISSSIRITADEKRKLLKALRRHKPHWSRTLRHVYVFSTLLFLLLRDHMPRLKLAIIDPEYPGHEPEIKGRVLMLFRTHAMEIHKDQLVFHRVGKKSPAHDLAIKVFRGKVSPGRDITAGEVLAKF